MPSQEDDVTNQSNIYRLCVELLQAWDQMQANNASQPSDDICGSTPEMDDAIDAIREHHAVKRGLRGLSPYQDGDTVTF